MITRILKPTKSEHDLSIPITVAFIASSIFKSSLCLFGNSLIESDPCLMKKCHKLVHSLVVTFVNIISLVYKSSLSDNVKQNELN